MTMNVSFKIFLHLIVLKFYLLMLLPIMKKWKGVQMQFA